MKIAIRKGVLSTWPAVGFDKQADLFIAAGKIVSVAPPAH